MDYDTVHALLAEAFNRGTNVRRDQGEDYHRTPGEVATAILQRHADRHTTQDVLLAPYPGRTTGWTAWVENSVGVQLERTYAPTVEQALAQLLQNHLRAPV